MSLFSAGEQIVNNIVDTAEDVVDTVVDTADDAEESGATTVVEIIVAIVTTTADNVAPIVNAGLTEMKGKAGGLVQDATTTGLRLVGTVAGMTAGVLAATIAVGVQGSRGFANTVADVLRLTVAIATYAVTNNLAQADAQIDQLRGELGRLSGQITRLMQELERLKAREEQEKTRAEAGSRTSQQIMKNLASAADALAALRNTIGGAGASGDAPPSEKEYQSAAELAWRLNIVVGRLSLVMRRRAAANPRLLLAHGALQRLSGHLQLSGANLLQARSAIAVKQLKTPITLTPGIQRPVTRA